MNTADASPETSPVSVNVDEYSWRRWVLSCGLAALVIVMLSSLIANFLSEGAEKWVEHTITLQSEVTNLLSTVNDAETGQRGYLITGDESYLKPYEAAVQTLPVLQQRITDLTADNPRQQQRIEEFKPASAERMAIIKRSIAARRAGNTEEAFNIVRESSGKRLMDRLRDIVGEMRAEEQSLIAERVARATFLRRVELFFIIGSLLLAAGLTAWMMRNMLGEIDTVRRISSELARSNADLERRVKERTEALERSQRDIRNDRDRLGSLLMASAQIFWTADPDGLVVDESPSWRAFTGQSHEEFAGEGWLNALHPDDRERIHRLWREAVAAKTSYATEYRLRHATGEYRWTAVNGTPLFGANGVASGWIGMNSDISIRKRQEEQLAFVMRELSHRSKNLLAMVQAMARQTARQSSKIEDFLAMFSGRLQALARSHDALLQKNWQGASLARLIEGHIVPLEGGAKETRVAMAGPDIQFKPEAAQTIGLALHELWTNATKYGALSTPEGHVAITWKLAKYESGKDHLHIEWKETGGPPVKPAKLKGFGRTVIEGMVAQTLGGTVELAFEPDGVRWSVDAPTTHLADHGDDARAA